MDTPKQCMPVSVFQDTDSHHAPRLVEITLKYVGETKIASGKDFSVSLSLNVSPEEVCMITDAAGRLGAYSKYRKNP